jgi:hypothetical protein
MLHCCTRSEVIWLPSALVIYLPGAIRDSSSLTVDANIVAIGVAHQAGLYIPLSDFVGTLALINRAGSVLPSFVAVMRIIFQIMSTPMTIDVA